MPAAKRRNDMRNHRTVIAFLIAILAGCSMAPEYSRPVPPIAGAWPKPAETTGKLNAVQTDWRTFFPDPRLQVLIATALEHNRDLRIAVARVEEARAQYGITKADRVPNLNLSLSRAAQKIPPQFAGTSDPSGNGVPIVNERNDLSLTSVSFEVDFWGRVSSMAESARASYLATAEAQRAARISLVAEVVNAYFGLLEMEERIVISRETLASREKTKALVARGRQSGFASNIDLLQAEGAVESAKADLAATERQRAAATNYLTQLVGHSPDELPRGRPLLEQNVDGNLAVGIPSDVLLARPDVIGAEQRLIAANANIGAARAAFFPKLLLTAAFGVASRGVATLFNGDTGVWSYQPSLSMPLFDGGRLAGNTDIAEARKVMAVADYEKTIQQAFREVADLLSTRSTLNDQRQASEALLRSQEERYKIALARYKAGVASYLEVLDAQRELFGAQQGAIQARRAQLSAFAQLYKALGGGG